MSARPSPGFTEHRVPREHGNVYVRDFGGDGPAFVLMHGFPDNGRIYERLVPHLVEAGRRTVTFDFLGFGSSDKVAGARYSFAQQLGDLEAVVEALGLDTIVPVAHDASGPAAVNFALDRPDRTAAVVMMDAFYGDAPGLRVPEFIELFATKNLRALHRRFLTSPQQFGWLLEFQRDELQRGLSAAQRDIYETFLGPIIDENFRRQPSSAAAFAQMTYQLSDEIAATTARLVDFRRSTVPLRLIWGNADPYLHVSTAEYLRGQARHATLDVVDAGHWPQVDAPETVAKLMLAGC